MDEVKMQGDAGGLETCGDDASWVMQGAGGYSGDDAG